MRAANHEGSGFVVTITDGLVSVEMPRANPEDTQATDAETMLAMAWAVLRINETVLQLLCGRETFH